MSNSNPRDQLEATPRVTWVARLGTRLEPGNLPDPEEQSDNVRWLIPD